jgi:hypothetical protein
MVSGAMRGLGKSVRAKEWKKDGVIHLAFVCVFVLPEHTSPVQAFGGQEPEWYDVKVLRVTISTSDCHN